MRHVAALSPEKIPRDNEFHFRTRARALVERWQDILNAHKQSSPAPLSVPPTLSGVEGLKMSMNGALEVSARSDAEEVTKGTRDLDLNGTGYFLLPSTSRYY